MSGIQDRKRTYNSSLRRQQQQLTRDQIMEALCAIIREGRIHSFTIQEVADRAGVSYGSVYRHFATREALLEELYEWSGEGRFGDMRSFPAAPQEIHALIEKLVAMWEEHGDLAQAGTMALAALGLVPPSQRERDVKTRKLLEEAAPHLDPREAHWKAAVIRLLASSLTWATLRQRFGLKSDEIVSAMTWALETLLREAGQKRQDQGENREG